jgi:hypothetical protein
LSQVDGSHYVSNKANNAKCANKLQLFGVFGVICGNIHPAYQKQFAAEAATAKFKYILCELCTLASLR